ncbi:hypothetical protein C1645_490751 [Glomus cerebriforme]|uniref:Uncharacterized protein n=1 Tax=Glomus cerebriforme TaxID=658196 RepID=A0A397TAM5_9GLOM|nr:hypothetical protein C1645_490751 [Glomus cerebriforme]
MEELLSNLNKFNVRTEEELFADQFSKLSTDNRITGNQPIPSNQYTTHKMFGKGISQSKTSSKQENIKINVDAFSNNAWNHQFGTNNNDDTEAIGWAGWNQAQKANEDEGWGNLPDVNTSVNPNHTFGMNSILSAEILNLGNANVNQQRVFGSNSSKVGNKTTSYNNIEPTRGVENRSFNK